MNGSYVTDNLRGRRGELGPDRKLPAVLPVVLYNGERRWWPPCSGWNTTVPPTRWPVFLNFW
ncbi:hypothetical protein ACLD02_10485 [Alloalcanivorax sp. C16-2]|uniref:hypothetical protein n=1 Tax=Alloalcanivorax sp. C16-2 TaxID=3390052 RepID=UPI003970D9AF